jgi:DNA-directed RNA polymerase subunit M/transcription elongation factor TFIIS
MSMSEYKPVESHYKFVCSKCKSSDVWYSVYESSDGGHEDYFYHCHECDRKWIVEGSDY